MSAYKHTITEAKYQFFFLFSLLYFHSVLLSVPLSGRPRGRWARVLASWSHMDASTQREALNCGRELLYLLCGLPVNHCRLFHLISPCLTSVSQHCSRWKSQREAYPFTEMEESLKSGTIACPCCWAVFNHSTTITCVS